MRILGVGGGPERGPTTEPSGEGPTDVRVERDSRSGPDVKEIVRVVNEILDTTRDSPVIKGDELPIEVIERLGAKL